MIKGQRVWVQAIVDNVWDKSVDVYVKVDESDLEYVSFISKENIISEEPRAIKGKVCIEYDLDKGEVLSVKPMSEETKMNLSEYLARNLLGKNASQREIQRLIDVYNEV